MYYNPNRQNILNFKKEIYIAKKLEVVQDERLRQKVVYDTPKKYFFNVQPISADSEIREFGELAKSMQVAVITEKAKYLGKFDEFDVAYLDGANPSEELENGDKANYRVYAVRNQNAVIKIYFLKRVINQ